MIVYSYGVEIYNSIHIKTDENHSFSISTAGSREGEGTEKTKKLQKLLEVNLNANESHVNKVNKRR